VSGKSQFSEWSAERVAAMSARNRAARGRDVDPVYSAAHRPAMAPAQATLDVSTSLGDEIADDDLDKVKVKKGPTSKAVTRILEADHEDREQTWPVFEAMLRANRLPAPCYGFRFNAERKWRFDMAFPQHRVALEVDGGIWRKDRGAHGRPQNILRDMEKINAAQLAGWKVLRYTPEQLPAAIDDLKLCLGEP
jgi:very-short-patch-repair endonuclease